METKLMKNTLHFLDRVWAGVVFGLVCPLLCFLLAFLLIDNENSFSIFWYNFTHDAFPYDFEMNNANNELKKNILILSLILNLIVFYIAYFSLKFDRFIKGLVFITLFLVGLSYLFIY